MEYCGAGSVSDIMRIIERPVIIHTDTRCIALLLLLLFPLILTSLYFMTVIFLILRKAYFLTERSHDFHATHSDDYVVIGLIFFLVERRRDCCHCPVCTEGLRISSL